MRTSFRHQSEAQPPNGPLTAAASPDTPSHMPSQAVRGKKTHFCDRYHIVSATAELAWCLSIGNRLFGSQVRRSS
jgi:hypothetical protein